jgi:hypothetical protein
MGWRKFFRNRQIHRLAKQLDRVEAKLDAVLTGDAGQIAAAADTLRTGRESLARAVAAVPVPPPTT